MADDDIHPVFRQVLIEMNQGHETRQGLLADLETSLGRTVISYFTSFSMPVMIDDSDVDMLEGILQRADLSNGLALLLSSPGGETLAAERIINVCRSYSGTGEYWVIVPSKAKSAATLICFGSSKIIMSQTSELGPVDPQYFIEEDGTTKPYSAYNIVTSYDSLFSRAIAETGNIEPYIQQLAHYDERDIIELRTALELSVDISIRHLKSGMMTGLAEEDIKTNIEPFLTPEFTKTHGRPIFRDEARNCSLEIEDDDIRDDRWRVVHELYVRTNHFVSTQVAKCFESKDISYCA